MLFTLFISPFGEMLNLSSTGYLLTLPKIATIGIVFIWLANAIYNKDAKLFTAFFSSRIFICLWIFILAELFSFIGSHDLGVSVKDLIRLISLLVFIVLIAEILNDKKWLKRGIYVMLLASFFAGSLGIIESMTQVSALQLVGKQVGLHTRSSTGELLETGDPSAASPVETGSVFVRVQGPNSDPNIFAAYLIVILGLSLSVYTISGSRIFRLALIFLMGLFFMDIVLTNSRSGMSGTFITTLTFLLIAPYRKKKYLLMVLLVLMSLSPFVLVNFDKIMPSSYKKFHMTGISNIGEDPRINAWRAGINIITRKPVTGVGIGNFMGEYLRYRDTTFIQVSQPVQDTFIKIWAEGGVFAFAAFTLFVVVLFYGLIKCIIIHPDRQMKIISVGLIAGLIGLLPLHIAQENIWEQEFLWILFGLSAIVFKCMYDGWGEEPELEGTGERRRSRARFI